MNRRDRRSKLSEIAAVADSLRAAPIEAPDFTKSILDRVDAERPFLARSVRRRLPLVHLSVGAAVCAGVLTMALTHRWAPRAVELVRAPQPVSDVIRCVECSAQSPVEVLRQSVRSVAEVEPSELLTVVAAVASIAEADAGAPPAPPSALVPKPFVGPVLPIAAAMSREPAPRPSSARADSGFDASPARALLRPSPALAAAPGADALPTRPGLLMAADRPAFRTAPVLIDYEIEIPGLAK